MADECPADPPALRLGCNGQRAQVADLDESRLGVDPASREPNVPGHPIVEHPDVPRAVSAARQGLLEGNDLRAALKGTADHVADSGRVRGHLTADRGRTGGVHLRTPTR